MYMYAWKKGLKTTYYLRSRPATKIAKTTVQSASRVRTRSCRSSFAVKRWPVRLRIPAPAKPASNLLMRSIPLQH